ncbi:hypothetical protein Tco_1393650 [Tanacetum coccineum]
MPNLINNKEIYARRKSSATRNQKTDLHKTRWVPTGKLLNSCTGKVENEPTHGSIVDIPHIHAYKQTLGLSAGTSFNGQKQQRIDITADALYNEKQENLRVWLLKFLISKKPVPECSDLAPQRQEMSVENVSSGLVPQGQKASDYDNSDPVPPRQNVVLSKQKRPFRHIKHKARLVAKGYAPGRSVDLKNPFAPVSRFWKQGGYLLSVDQMHPEKVYLLRKALSGYKAHLQEPALRYLYHGEMKIILETDRSPVPKDALHESWLAHKKKVTSALRLGYTGIWIHVQGSQVSAHFFDDLSDGNFTSSLTLCVELSITLPAKYALSCTERYLLHPTLADEASQSKRQPR